MMNFILGYLAGMIFCGIVVFIYWLNSEPRKEGE